MYEQHAGTATAWRVAGPVGALKLGRDHLPVGVVLFLAGYALISVLGQSSTFMRRVMSDGVYFLPLLFAIALAYRSSRNGPPAVRRGWALVAGGLACWLVGEAIFSGYDWLGGEAPVAGPADLFYLAGYSLLAASLTFLFTPGARPSRSLRDLIDLVALSTLVVMFIWAEGIGPVAGASDLGAVAGLVNLAYPVMDLVMLAGVLWLCLNREESRLRAPELLLAGAVAAIALADSAYLKQVIGEGYRTGDFVDSFWVAGFLLVGLAASRTGREGWQPGGLRDVDVGSYVVYGAVFLAGLIVLFEAWTSEIHRLEVAGWFAAVTLLSMRHVIEATENRRFRRELHRLALTDELTGLWNRRGLTERGQSVLERAAEQGPVTVLALDIDNFKQLNDTLGHASGDIVLRNLGASLSRLLPAGGEAYRIGGDELAVVLPLHRQAAEAFFLGLQLSVRGEGIPSCTLSGGMASAWAGCKQLPRLLVLADEALLTVKASGKGRLLGFAEEASDLEATA